MASLDIDDTAERVRDRAANLLNSRGRSIGHVALGLGLSAGFVLLAGLAANRAIPPRRLRLGALGRRDGPITERPRGPLSLILPAVFSATTLSAVRVWNAPRHPARGRALGLWVTAQAVNAAWVALRPASRPLQIAAAMSSAGLAAAFAHEARKLDPKAGKLAAPTGGGAHLANSIERGVTRP